jgi:hypothetical protein
MVVQTIEEAEVVIYYDGDWLFQIEREPDDWYEALALVMAERAPA